MNSNIEVDRLSILPDDIIDSILTRLPIKEAMRTSILSRSWRYQWNFLSKIIIPYCIENTVNVVDHILLVHYGSVDKFTLVAYNLAVPATCNAIERWILFFSRNGVKELTIINKRNCPFYTFPSCVYSCSGLTHLHLARCIFKPPPAAFKTFSNLTELYFDEVKISDKLLEKLVNSSPLLIRLTLSSVDFSRDSSRLTLPEDKNCTSLKINAPNLLVFEFSNSHFDYQFQLKTPLLARFSLELSHIKGKKYCKLVELLCSMPNLQRIDFLYCAMQYFSVGDIPLRLPSICPIKSLIASYNPEDLQECLAFFCIFRSSPFVQHLDMELFSFKKTAILSADGFWEGECNFSFRFDHLRHVKMQHFRGSRSEFKFIKFLLGNTPVLKTMEFDFDSDVEDSSPIVSELNQLPCISPEAELTFQAYDDE